MPRAVVTGGAGFLGSHLCETLRERDWEVVAVDNFLTGKRENVAHLLDSGGRGARGFELVEHDVIDDIPVHGPVDAVLHFASPASPPAYLAHPIETLEVGAIGTRRALDLARDRGARFLVASTSEIYGDPLVHPQPESYWGNVNSTGPRAVYDEAKRYAEAITMTYRRRYALDTKIVRIFNTYGPRLARDDGRVISTFLTQASEGRPLTVHGDGKQTRSFCYVDDEVAGLLALLDSDQPGPMNIGNPDEFTMIDAARLVLEVTGSRTEIVHEPARDEDPQQRCPDITLAEQTLGWHPQIDLREGLVRTYEWYRRSVDRP